MLVVAVALVGSIGLAAVLALGTGTSSGSPEPSVGSGLPSIPASSPATVVEAEALMRLAYGAPETPSPLRAPVQNHLWYHDGSWWGVFLSSETSDHRVHRLDGASGTWISTDTVVDERATAHMDVVWDGDALVVASAGLQPSARHALRITRFSYIPEARGYVRDADFPIEITDAGVEAVTLLRSADGRLWTAYRSGARLELNHSLDSDLAWRGPFVPEQAAGVVSQAALAGLGDHVALVWTRPSDDVLYLATHDVTGPADRWVISPPARIPGLGLGENDLSITTDPSPGATKLLIGVRLGLDEAERTPRLDPQLMIVEVSVGEEPLVHLFGRVRDQYGAPLLVLDGGARELLVFAPVPRAGGSIYYKRASLDDLEFRAGLGTPLISASAEHPRLRNLTSTKQAVDRESGLVIAATDQSTGVYAFAALGVDLGEGGDGPSPGPRVAGPILEQTFDGPAVGSRVTGWDVSGEPPPSFTIAVLTGADGSARLSTEGTGGRACAPIGALSEGRVRIEAEGLFNMPTEGEVHLLQVRGDAGEAASIRLREGQLVYPDGGERVETDRVLAPGRWYRSVLTLDIASQTYGVEVRDVVSGTAFLDEEGLDWRVTDSASLDRICAEVPEEAGLDLYLNNVLVVPVEGDGG